METQWSEIGASQQVRNRSEKPVYLNPQPNLPVVVRLCGKAYRYLKHWSPISAISPGETDPLVQAGYTPQIRFATWTVDRSDGRVKILALPEIAAAAIGAWATKYARRPGGKVAPDFRLTLVKTERVFWRVEAGNVDMPVTPDEMAKLQAQVSRWKLAELYAPDTVERIAFLWEAYKADPAGPIPGSVKWQKLMKHEDIVTTVQEVAPTTHLQCGEECDY